MKIPIYIYFIPWSVIVVLLIVIVMGGAFHQQYDNGYRAGIRDYSQAKLVHEVYEDACVKPKPDISKNFWCVSYKDYNDQVVSRVLLHQPELKELVN